ncbi:DUF5060 domain-containing protein, partial [bacterium]|nr:DUF5060 domain-containing protein [bacterium]
MKSMTRLPGCSRNRVVLATLLAAGLPLLALAADRKVEFKPAADSASCYDFLEWTVSVPEPVISNPFTEAVLEGRFTLEGEAGIKVDGFCDSEDGKLFRIRFMPARAGHYTCTLTY